ncbi:MAG TPA: hypothetical protein VE753_06580 [Gaiellaceae bacterium]|nr:hypothetical protein [Gaiellaceae bacterium]
MSRSGGLGMRRQRRPPSVVRSRKYRAVPFADSCTPVAQRVFVVTRASCEPSPPGIPPMRRHVEPPPSVSRTAPAPPGSRSLAEPSAIPSVEDESETAPAGGPGPRG